MRVNVSWTSWAAVAWGLNFPSGLTDLFLPSLPTMHRMRMHYVFSLSATALSLCLSRSLAPPTELDSIKQGMVIKRNVSAFIRNSSEYRCAHCAHSVLLGISGKSSTVASRCNLLCRVRVRVRAWPTPHCFPLAFYGVYA